MGFTFTLIKGKQHVLSEINLMTICYNPRRIMTTFTIKELKIKLKELKFNFYALIETFTITLSYYLYQKQLRYLGYVKIKVV